MCKKLIFLISIVLVLGLVNSAVAEVLMHFGFDGTPGQPLPNTLVDLTGNVTFKKVTEDAGALTYGESNPQVKTGGASANFAHKAGLERAAVVGDDILDLSGPEYTIECFIKVNSFPDYDGHVIIKKYRDDYYWELRSDGHINYNQAGDRVDGHRVESEGGSIVAGQWYHIAAVFDTAAVEPQKFYIDAVKVAGGGTAELNPGTDEGISIGHMWRPVGTKDDWFDGMIDEFRIHDVALGPGEFGVYEEAGPQAWSPSPPNGIDDVRPDVVLSWVAGIYAQDVNMHDVYFGTDFSDVNDATTSSSEYKGRQTENRYDPCDIDPCGLLEYDKAYYWRVDEINDACLASPWKGYAWNFTTDDGTAKNPSPADGKWGVPLYKLLSWTPGISAADVNGHDVYFGTDVNDVNDANTAVTLGVYKGRQSDPNYDPGGLEAIEYYYWRIDEINDSNLWKGHVWAFRAGGLLLGEYLFVSKYAIVDPNYEFRTHDTSDFGYDGYLTSGAWIGYEGVDALYLINNADPLGGWPAHMKLPSEFGKVNPFDGTSDFTIIMDFKVADGNDPNGILLSSARNNSPSNHAMNIFIRDDGRITYNNWNVGSVTTGPGHADQQWHNLVVTHQASDHAVAVTVDDVETAGTVNPQIPNVEDDSVMVGWSLETKYPAQSEEWEEEDKALDFHGRIDNLRIYDYVIRFKAWNEDPNSNATDVHPDSVLNWTPGDFATSHDVYFGSSIDDVNASATPVSPGQALDANSYDPSGSLEFATKYYWRVDEVNGADEWTGRIWNFTITDGTARNERPANDANKVHPEVVLTWSPGGYWVKDYDIYFSEDWNDVNDRTVGGFKGTQDVDANSYDPLAGLGLDFGKTYYWRIDEANDSNEWKGHIWYFLVDDGKARYPDPCDTNDVIHPDANLSWTPGIAATSHDIYFGTSFDDVNNGTGGTFLATVVMDANSCDPGPLTLGVTYYWRADSQNASGKGYATLVKSDVWSFTVEHGKASRPRPYGPSWRIELDRILTWTPGKYATSCDVYFGTDFDDINDATTLSSVYIGSLAVDVNSYDPGGLALDTTHYWRIDGIGPEPRLNSRGDVWHFKTIKTGLQLILMIDVTKPMGLDDPNFHKPGWTFLTKKKGDPCGADGFGDSGDQLDGFLTWWDVNAPNGTSTGIDVSLDGGATGNMEGRSRNVGEPLCRDLFMSDEGDGPPDLDFLLKLGDLPAGYYELTTYHNDPEDDPNDKHIGTVNVSGAMSSPVGDTNIKHRGVKVDEGCSFSFVTFKATGTGDVTIRYVCHPKSKQEVCFNGFILEYIPPDPAFARSPNPGGGEPVQPDVGLSWAPGIYAHDPGAHELYFGTDFNDVNDANTAVTLGVYIGAKNLDANSWDPPGFLTLGRSYYWRVDEVWDANGDRWKGDVWSFTVTKYLLVDDFESYAYDHINPLVYDVTVDPNGTWIDGWMNYTGSILNLVAAPNDLPIHSGRQSMDYWYDNTMTMGGSDYYSEASRPISGNWRDTGVKALSVWFHGEVNSPPEQMYVALEDDRRPDANHIAVVKYDGDANDLSRATWREWHIELSEFTDVNLASLSRFYLGFGDRDNPQYSGTGLYSYAGFDDIRVYPNRCVPKFGPEFDLTKDCVVDHRDLEIVANDWLKGDYTIAAVEPCHPELLLIHYAFDETDGNTAYDSSGHGYDAVGRLKGAKWPWTDGPVYDPFWEPEAGKYDGCIRFQGEDIKDYALQLPTEAFADANRYAISILVWVNWYNEVYGSMPDATNQLLSMHRGTSDLLGVATDWLDDGVEFWDADEDVEYEPNKEDWSGAWNHYAFVKDANNKPKGYLRIYLNGVQIATADSNESMNWPPTIARIGMATDDRWHDEYTGLLDDLQIYTYAMSAGEIAYVGGGGQDLYVPLVSDAELYVEEPNNFKKVNFKDYALFMDGWLDKKWYPEGPP